MRVDASNHFQAQFPWGLPLKCCPNLAKPGSKTYLIDLIRISSCLQEDLTRLRVTFSSKDQSRCIKLGTKTMSDAHCTVIKMLDYTNAEGEISMEFELFIQVSVFL